MKGRQIVDFYMNIIWTNDKTWIHMTDKDLKIWFQEFMESYIYMGNNLKITKNKKNFDITKVTFRRLQMKTISHQRC